MASNIQVARMAAEEAERTNSRPFNARASGWVGEDSDFPTRYWRVGGNAVVYDDPYCGFAWGRWHDFVQGNRHLRYPAR